MSDKNNSDNTNNTNDNKKSTNAATTVRIDQQTSTYLDKIKEEYNVSKKNIVKNLAREECVLIMAENEKQE